MYQDESGTSPDPRTCVSQELQAESTGVWRVGSASIRSCMAGGVVLLTRGVLTTGIALCLLWVWQFASARLFCTTHSPQHQPLFCMCTRLQQAVSSGPPISGFQNRHGSEYGRQRGRIIGSFCRRLVKHMHERRLLHLGCAAAPDDFFGVTSGWLVMNVILFKMNPTSRSGGCRQIW